MRILKTIKSVNLYKDDEMKRLIGGSNKNGATGCTCSGSTNSFVWCADNSNQGTSCTCSGSNNNINEVSSCSCS